MFTQALSEHSLISLRPFQDGIRPHHTPESAPVPTRESILDAAEQVIRDRGIARATTKAIAETAGCSEGSIYNHFSDKHDLILTVANERLAPFLAYTTTLPGLAGTRTVEENLTELVDRALTFFLEKVPAVAAAMADRQVREERRNVGPRRPHGPREAMSHIVAYLDAEVAAGRLDRSTNTAGTACALVGACFHYAFLLATAGPDALLSGRDQFVDDLVASQLAGLQPKEA